MPLLCMFATHKLEQFIQVLMSFTYVRRKGSRGTRKVGLHASYRTMSWNNTHLCLCSTRTAGLINR